MKKPDHKQRAAEILRLHRQGLTQPEIYRKTGYSRQRIWKTLLEREGEPEGLNCGRCWHVMKENGKRTKEEVREWLKGRNDKERTGIPGCGPVVLARLKAWAHEEGNE